MTDTEKLIERLRSASDLTAHSNTIRVSVYPSLLHEAASALAAAREREMALEEGLIEIKRLKSTPIGNTGFAVGPASLLHRAQEIARNLTRKPRAAPLLSNGDT